MQTETQTKSPPGLRKRNAGIALAMLLNEKLGIVVLPSTLRETLNEHWDEISRLAHEIHDEGRHGPV